MTPIRLAAAVGSAALALAAAASAQPAAPAYRLAQTIPLGAPDRWDYVVYDSSEDRVYVAHSDRLTVVDPKAGKVLGDVQPIAGGTHGTGVSKSTGQGFTDDGRAGVAVAFDLKTLAIKSTIPAAPDADGIVADKASGHIFVVDGDSGKVTVIDPKTDKAVGDIDGGGKLEAAVADDHGRLYINGEEKHEIVVADTRSGKVLAHWPMPTCQSPHGIAVDYAGKRLFSTCANSVMVVLNTQTGAVVTTVPIGRGSDSAGWDPVRKRAFSSNGEGTISVIQQKTPDTYVALTPVPTIRSARTMAVDPASGRLFVAGGDFDPNSPAGQRPRLVPGSLRLMVFEPAS
jgi:YVTN family beta-propeller protein